MLKGIKKEVTRILLWQLVLIMGLALVLFLLKGMQSGLSTLLGGLAYWLPTGLFVWRVFGRHREPKRFMVEFVTGEAIKLFLSGILFVIVVKLFPVNIVWVLCGFIGAVMAFWVSSMMLLANDPEVRS